MIFLSARVFCIVNVFRRRNFRIFFLFQLSVIDSSNSAGKMVNNGNSAVNGEMNGNSSVLGDFDTNLYSRQLYTLGETAMRRLRCAKVLISGIGGVGVEIAKNLILGGIRHVTIHDTKNTEFYDLSSQVSLIEGVSTNFLTGYTLFF